MWFPKRNFKRKKEKHNEYEFYKKIRMCEPQISLRLRVLFEKMEFKNWKEKQDSCYNIGFFKKHVGRRKTTMIVKGMAKRVHHKNEIAYTSTCKDNVVQ
jgi:hypothetical protein